MMEKTKTIIGKDILLLGIGTAGSRSAYYVFQHGSLPGLRITAMDSDVNALQKYSGLNTVEMPVPEKLETAAEIEDPERMPEVLKNALDAHFASIAMVLVVAGMGGKTGGRYALQAVSYAKQHAIPCAAVVLLPHEFEGEEHRIEAENNLTILSSMIQTVMVLPCVEFMQLFPNQSRKEIFPQAVRWMAECSLGFLKTFSRIPTRKKKPFKKMGKNGEEKPEIDPDSDENQLEFMFSDEPRGIFVGGFPSNYDGQNLDIPTYERQSIAIDCAEDLEE